MLGKPGCCAKNGPDKVEQSRIGFEQRKELHPCRKAREEPIESNESLIGIAGTRESRQERRHEFGQQFARAGAARRGIAAEMPAPHGCSDFAGLTIAHRRQCHDGLGIILAAGEDEASGISSKLGGVFEQGCIMSLHRAQDVGQARLKFRGRCEAAEQRKCREGLRIVRQCLRLLVIEHLQAMLDEAQEPVGPLQSVGDGGRDPQSLGQRIQHLERAPAAQSRIAAAGDQLLSLDEKFDLANAAAAELDIMPKRGNRVMTFDRVDLALEGVNVGNSREVEIFAPDIGLQTRQKLLAKFDVAGDGTRLDHGGALPVLAEIFVIDRGSLKRDGDLRGARVGPQPQVDAIGVAVLGHILQQANQALGEPDEEGRRLDRAAPASPDSGSNRTIRSISLE